MLLFLKIVVVLIGYSLACLGVGDLSLRGLARFTKQSQQTSVGTEMATAFILGQGVLASFWLFLALKGWFFPGLVIVIVLITAVNGIFWFRNRWVDFKRQLVSIWRDLRSEAWMWQLVAGLTVFLCWLWVTSLGRSLGWDGMSYYLPLPKTVAASHQLTPLRGYEEFSSVGFQGEAHFATMMALGSPDAAQLFAWPTSIAAAIMLLALGRQVGIGRWGQWVILAIFYSSSAITYLSGDGKVDIFALALGIAAYYWSMQLRSGPRRLAALLTGLFLGFSIVAKLSYILPMGVSMFFLILWNFWDEYTSQDHQSDALKNFFNAGIYLGVAFVIAILPHLMKNGLLLGNPFLPFGSAQHYWENQAWYGPDITRRVLLTYPLALTYGSYTAQGGNLSPLMLAFLPFALFLERPRSWLRSRLAQVTLAASVGILAWAVLRPSVLAPRYMLATLMLLALLPAKAVEHARLKSRSRWLIAGILVSLLITQMAVARLSYSEGAFSPIKTYQYLTGELGACGRDYYHYCQPQEFLNQETELGDRVLLAAYPRYWLRADLLQCLGNYQDTSKIFSAPDDGYWLAMYQQGFSYLLVDSTTHAAFLDNLNVDKTPDWLVVQKIWEDEKTLVFHLDVLNPPGDPVTVCQRRENSQVWEVVSP